MDGTLAREPPCVDEALIEASLTEATGVPPSQSKRVSLGVLGARRPPDRMVVGSYIEPMEWVIRPIEDEPTLDQEAARVLISYRRPFNYRDSFIAHMRDLYPPQLLPTGGGSWRGVVHPYPCQ